MGNITTAQRKVINRALGILEKSLKYHEVVFTNPTDTENFFKLRFAGVEREEFHVAYLNNNHRLIECETEFVGTINGASVYPREIVKSAMKHNAAAVLFAHNHPSGVTDPSSNDRQITERLVSALGLLDVRVLDHIVVAGTSTTSFASLGYL